MEDGISIGNGILWVLIWFGFMLLYTFLDVAVWRKVIPVWEKYLNVITIVLSIVVFLNLLTRKNGFRVDLFRNISFQGILFAIGCAILLYVLLDRGLDPVFEKIFPTSEESYQETLQVLSKAPIISLLQVCILETIPKFV